MGQNGKSRIASRAEILSAFKKSLQKEEVELPEAGITVLVWELTAPERAAYQEALTTSKHRIPIGGKRGADRSIEIESHAARGLMKLCAMSLKDEDGLRMFDEEDLVWMPSRCLMRIFQVAERLSGLAEDAMTEAGEGSTPTPTSPSTSTSPTPSESAPSESTE